MCRAHFRVEHGKTMECPFCDFGSSKNPADLDVRLLLQQSLTTTSDETKLRRHIFNDHYNVLFRRYRCKYCHTSLRSAEMLAEHQNKDLDPALRKGRLCTKLTTGSFNINRHVICSYCGDSFNASYIKRHVQRIHEKNLPRDYRCQFCPKSYELPKRLRNHILQWHLPEKKDLGCHICSKKFSSHQRLRQHIKTHGQPTVKCPKCEKGEFFFFFFA